jgi:hypothetical protein
MAPELGEFSLASVRFTYVFEGSVVQVVGAEPVQAIAWRSHPLGPGPRAGFWYEVVDADRTTLWRRIRSHPLEPTVESRTETDDDVASFYQRGVAGPAAGSFDLIVPGDIPGAAFVVLVGTPPDGPDGAPAVDLFTHLIEPFVL